MTDENAELAKIKVLHEPAQLLQEGGAPAVFLPGLPFRAAGQDHVDDLLLFPQFHSGYATRLFFEKKIAGRGANWTQHYVADRQWWACSWGDVPANMNWPAMLCAHLRAVA